MNILPPDTTVLPYVWLPRAATHLMFFAVAGFQAPVLRSKSPGFHSVRIPSPRGVLFRIVLPPHWLQSPGLIVGFCVGTFPPAAARTSVVCAATCTACAGLSVAGCAWADFSSAGLS